MAPPPQSDDPITPGRGMRMAWPWLAALLLRAAAFTLLWWTLMDGAGGGTAIAALSVAAATIISLRLWAPREWVFQPVAWFTFIPWFLWNSLLAGIDVSWRAFHPRMPLRPGIVELDLDGNEQHAVLFAWTVSLIPGTACIRLTAHHATLHVLDTSRPYRGKLDALITRIAGLCARPHG